MKRELFVSSKFNPKTLPQDYICVLSRAKFALYLAVTSRGRFSWGGDFFFWGGLEGVACDAAKFQIKFKLKS